MDSKENKRMCKATDYNHDLFDDDYFGDVLNNLDFPVESLEGDGLTEDWASKLGPIPAEVFRPVGGGSPDLLGGIKLEPDEPKYQPVLKIETLKSQPKPQPPDSSQEKPKYEPVLKTETLKSQPKLQPPDFSQEKVVHRIQRFLEARPDSVLQSRSSNSTEKTKTSSFGTQIAIPVRTRTKRSKSKSKSTVNPWSRSLQQFPIQTTKIKIKKKKKVVDQQPVNEMKKCSHCEMTKTPQWREGPMGPKTLCNACGVRYRSGRLFPEYRPAASPTFIPALHSNSHRKVIEMRQKGAGINDDNYVVKSDSTHNRLCS